MSKRRLMSLDELMRSVGDALDCCSIDVTVWEIGDDPHRPTESSDSLHRLTKCLRSHGVLDEYTTRPEKSRALIGSEIDAAEQAWFDLPFQDQARTAGRHAFMAVWLTENVLTGEEDC